jgi:hypothetical protein
MNPVYGRMGKIDACAWLKYGASTGPITGVRSSDQTRGVERTTIAVVIMVTRLKERGVFEKKTIA